MWRYFQTFQAHRFRYSWNLSFNHLEGGFGGDIAGTHPGSPRRNNQIKFVTISEIDNLIADQAFFIRNDRIP